MPATPAIIPAHPKLWREGFRKLSPSVSPCLCLAGPNRIAIHAKAADLLDRWADQAADLGRTTLLLCGGNPKNGTVRVDYCGAMTMGTALVDTILADRIKAGNTTFYRDTPGKPEGAVPLWLFGK